MFSETKELYENSIIGLLKEHEIQFDITQHESKAFSCEDVARERRVRLSQVLKCLVCSDRDGNTYILLIPGDKFLKIKEVRRLTDGLKIDLMSHENLGELFDVIVGAISPLQFLGTAKFFMDKAVLNEEFIDISSGSPNAGFKLKTSDLVALIEPVIDDITSTRPYLDTKTTETLR
ncbi:hypothetical protein FACS1894208_08400 [Clostridia bacterium]|nr:hypothetical protein FACS1894208_08400 [Clostridia bacterium]